MYVGDDVNANMTLTPNHFLTLNPRTSIPEIYEDDSDPDYKRTESSADRLIKVWLKGQKLLKTFWHTWQGEYLLSLRERSQSMFKPRKNEYTSEPKVNDVVIIKDELPRSCWRMGRITNTVRSKDGHVRSAEVRLASGRVLRRPLNLLFPIETTEYSGNTETSERNNDNCETHVLIPRPCREAAAKAKRAIRQQLQ